MSAVSIPKGPIQLAGLLYQPTLLPGAKAAGLVVIHPAGGVKEQTAGIYARKLADAGFVTICYDAAHQGESGGEPHFLEDPFQRVSDVWAVVDYLQKLDSVDPNKIGVVGVCAGGGFAVDAAKADHRIKAVAGVSTVNMGDSVRRGWNGDEDPTKHVAALDMAAQQMSLESKGAAAVTLPYCPPQLDPNGPYDMTQVFDYYLTPRGQHPRSENKMLMSSLPRMFAYDAFHLADLLLKQPTLLIAGDKAGTLWHTERLVGMVGDAARKVIVENGTHVDFYDKEEFVGPAVVCIAEFMDAQFA